MNDDLKQYLSEEQREFWALICDESVNVFPRKAAKALLTELAESRRDQAHAKCAAQDWRYMARSLEAELAESKKKLAEWERVGAIAMKEFQESTAHIETKLDNF